MFTDAVRAIAYKELSDKLRSRWVIVIAAGFALFTIVISYFGAAPSGIAGFRKMEATIASLTSLVTYFIPILALTLGGGIVADERERGTLDIFLASPITAREFIIGKFSGLFLALALSTLAGFGVSGIVLLTRIGTEGVGSYMLFILNSVVLGVIFLSISLLISVIFYERTKVIALSVFLWLFFSVLYDLGLVGLLIVSKGSIGSDLFSFLLMLNPVDLYRIVNFISIGEFKAIIGLSSVEFPAYMRSSLIWGIGLLWIILPLWASFYFFKRRYYE